MTEHNFRLPSITMNDVGGVCLRAAFWQATEKSNKLPILFFNGIGANLELAYPFADLIRDRDVLTFDVPGIGGSPDVILPYRLWKLAKWVKELTKQFNISKVDVVGVSWGGIMAQQYAHQYSNSVNAVTLAATSPGSIMVPGKVRSLKKMLNPRRYAQPEFLRESFQELYGDKLCSRGMLHTVMMQAPSPRGYIYQLIAITGFTSLPILPRLKQPVLVMMGDRDTVVPLMNGRIISKLAPNSKLKVLEDAGHLFFVTRTELVVPQILEFFDC